MKLLNLDNNLDIDHDWTGILWANGNSKWSVMERQWGCHHKFVEDITIPADDELDNTLIIASCIEITRARYNRESIPDEPCDELFGIGYK